MTYREVLDYLYTQTPLFQNSGASAYKEGLYNTLQLDERTGHPHKLFKTIHVAGTNGKGSVSHTLAAILQAQGYKTGLYTSPHLLDFRERIRVNGKCISPEYVINFIEENKSFLESLHPSFFEVATAMAFSWFAQTEIDIAVVETGLGGRLDCTNIIDPRLSIITNIGFDHVRFLGDTLNKIAYEKAGIIKPGRPVVIGEYEPETRPVFEAKAKECNSRIVFAQDLDIIKARKEISYNKVIYQADGFPDLESALTGDCQVHNAATILASVQELRKCRIKIDDSSVRQGFQNVCRTTGLMGRWQKVASRPDIICDTGHNSHGIKYIAAQLRNIASAPGFGKLRIVMGMVNDKDITAVLDLMPENAEYYFAKASVDRALDSTELKSMAEKAGLHGRAYPNVAMALSAARSDSSLKDLIFVGGSTFIVADLLALPDFFIIS